MTFLCKRAWLLWAGACCSAPVQAASGFEGDVGVGLSGRQPVVQGIKGTAMVLPYVWGEWGPAFARIDTLGVRTLAMGAGHLELVGRVSTEGWKPEGSLAQGLQARANPVPLGLGTFQRMSWGGVFVYALHDVRSGGTQLEASWAGRVSRGPLTLYPQAGLEYRSRTLVRHLVGVTAAQASASGVAPYAGRAATQPQLGLSAQWRLGAAESTPWSLQAQWRQTWLGAAVQDSPLVDRSRVQSGFLALSYSLR